MHIPKRSIQQKAIEPTSENIQDLIRADMTKLCQSMSEMTLEEHSSFWASLSPETSDFMDYRIMHDTYEFRDETVMLDMIRFFLFVQELTTQEGEG